MKNSNRSYPATRKTVVVNNYDKRPSNYNRNQPSTGEIAIGLVTCVVAALAVASKALDLAGGRR